jgi:hypothetical protein
MIYKKIVYNLPLFKAWNWVYLLSHLVIFGVGLRLFLQKKILGLIVLGFYLSVLPESGFFPIDHVYFEHRYYVPMFFILIGVYSLFSKYKIAPVLVLFLCIPLIWSTYSRNKLFGLEDYNKIYHEKKVKYEFPLAYFVFNWNDKKLLTNFTQEIISKELYPNQIKTIARFSIIESFSEDEKNQIDIDFTNLLKNTDNYKVIEDYTYNWRHIWNFLIYKFFNYLSLKESNEKAVNTIYEIMLKNKHFYDYYQDRTIKTFKLKIYMDRYKILKNKNPEELTEAEKIYLIRYKKVFNPN